MAEKPMCRRKIDFAKRQIVCFFNESFYKFIYTHGT